MGRLSDDLGGGFNGRVGKLVYYSYKGMRVVRMIGRITAPPTVKQLAARQAMALVMGLLRPLRAVVGIGFAVAAAGAQSAFNRAVSYQLRYAVRGEYTSMYLDHEAVRLAAGSLVFATGAQVSLVGDGLRFSWDVDAEDWARAYDRVVMVAYFPGLERAEYVLDGVLRSFGVGLLYLAEELRTERMLVYLFFAAADGAEVSESRLMGAFNF